MGGVRAERNCIQLSTNAQLVLDHVSKLASCSKSLARLRGVFLPNAWRGAALARAQDDPAQFDQRAVGPQNLATSGSRELPSVMQLYGSGVNESKAMGECIAPKRFREPPVFIVFSGINVVANPARAAGHAPKRLPSRRRAVVRGNNANQLYSRTKRLVPPHANLIPSC